jgi:arylsulfatase
VIIWGDDIGQSDISAYSMGLMGFHTPNIDRIAHEGMIFTDYYAEQSSTAGRASFITGQSGLRTGMTKVGLPGATTGLQKEDPTIAELLKSKGYATGQFGKNHLGDRNEYLPTVHGFDEFYGFLYHLNMMEMPEQPEFPKNPNFPGRPRNVVHSLATDTDDATIDPRWGRVGRQKIEDGGPLGSERMKTFDNEVLDRSLGWMKTQVAAKKPFFLWFNPSRMHQQTHVGKEWEGKSGHSTYADGVMQMDWLVGQVLDTLDSLGVAGKCCSPRTTA